MNSNEFRSKLALIGIKQAQFALIINVSANTVSTTLKRDKMPVLWQLAVEALLHYSNEQIDQFMGVE